MLGQGDYAYAESLLGERRPILIDLLDAPSPAVEKYYKYVTRKNDKIYAESFVQRLHGGQGAHLWGVASPLFDREGRRCGTIEVMRDVTEHKLASWRCEKVKENTGCCSTAPTVSFCEWI